MLHLHMVVNMSSLPVYKNIESPHYYEYFIYQYISVSLHNMRYFVLKLEKMVQTYHFSICLSIMRYVPKCHTTVVPTKSDSSVIFCLQLLSKTLTCTLHLSFANR